MWTQYTQVALHTSCLSKRPMEKSSHALCLMLLIPARVCVYIEPGDKLGVLKWHNASTFSYLPDWGGANIFVWHMGPHAPRPPPSGSNFSQSDPFALAECTGTCWTMLRFKVKCTLRRTSNRAALIISGLVARIIKENFCYLAILKRIFPLTQIPCSPFKWKFSLKIINMCGFVIFFLMRKY